jgi:hypothetical protein
VFGAMVSVGGAVETSYSSITYDRIEVVESFGPVIQISFTLNIRVSTLDEMSVRFSGPVLLGAI